jgi:hypothetical protein
VDFQANGKPRDELLCRLDGIDAQRREHRVTIAVTDGQPNGETDSDADCITDREPDVVTDALADTESIRFANKFARRRL